MVTGAGRGLGAALAVSLAQAGARIAAVGLEPDQLAATVARCGPGAGARAWTADVTGSDRMQAVAAEVGAHFGRVDVVVANAGIGLGGCRPRRPGRLQPGDRGEPARFGRHGPGLPARAAGVARLLPPGGVAGRAGAGPADDGLRGQQGRGGGIRARAAQGEVAHQGVAVGVAYLSWTDTDMVRAADEDEVLCQDPAGLPGPAGWTAPLEARPSGAWWPGSAAGRRGCTASPGCVPRRVAAPRAAAGHDGPAGLPGYRPPGPGPLAEAGRRRAPLGPGGRAAMPAQPAEPAD